MASLIRLTPSAFRRLVALCLIAATAIGAAQRPEVDRERIARAKFVEGTKAYNLGQFEAALTAYKEAFELKPHPGFLFNIAQCYRHLGQYATAAFYYRRYRNEAQLSAADALVLEDLLADVEDRQEELEREERAQAELARQRDLELARAAAVKAAAEAEVQRRPQTVVISAPSVPPPRQTDSVFKKWWFWTGVGVVAGGAIYLAIPAHSRDTTMGNVNAR
jgi:tetratricopeptide (TPR) repeat protein